MTPTEKARYALQGLLTEAAFRRNNDPAKLVIWLDKVAIPLIVAELEAVERYGSTKTDRPLKVPENGPPVRRV